MEESTVYSYTMTLARLRGMLGHIRLQELAEDDVEAWMKWALSEGRVRGGKAGTGLGVASVEMSLARLKEALDRAVARRLVEVNVAREVKVPRNHRKAERRAKTMIPPWNLQEVRAFVRAVKGDRLCAVFLLSLMGLRPAEICGMRWTDVDLDGVTLTVNRTRTLMGNKGVVEKDTKSFAGERQLPLPDLVCDALAAFKATQIAEKLAAGERYEEDKAYVLVDGLGRALNGRQLRERAYKVMAENGLRRVRLYDARTGCFTYPANKAVPDHLLARGRASTSARPSAGP
ncbi:tyrosine recombinase XerC [Streptomyces anulatus]|uniref:site-specific integrase n=1 Tax=Streptomyces anulatus TaxID=1892 RepID=UPI003655FFC4